jgi:hypothetical protein
MIHLVGVSRWHIGLVVRSCGTSVGRCAVGWSVGAALRIAVVGQRVRRFVGLSVGRCALCASLRKVWPTCAQLCARCRAPLAHLCPALAALYASVGRCGCAHRCGRCRPLCAAMRRFWPSCAQRMPSFGPPVRSPAPVGASVGRCALCATLRNVRPTCAQLWARSRPLVVQRCAALGRSDRRSVHRCAPDADVWASAAQRPPEEAASGLLSICPGYPHAHRENEPLSRVCV